MTTLFVSDLHLDPSRPQLLALFERLLAGEARDAEALYILGDLFEAYIGDDDDAQLPARIAHALRALADHGVPITFIAGNRDFLLGETYAARAGMRLLEDASVVDLHGVPTLLMHGDVLCTDDHDYQAFRARVRDPLWQAQFLARPLDARRTFAAAARVASNAHTTRSEPEIMDVHPQAVAAALVAAGVQRLIHGHTHRPAVHRFRHRDGDAERIVLGDWYEQGSVLRAEAGRIDLSPLAT